MTRPTSNFSFLLQKQSIGYNRKCASCATSPLNHTTRLSLAFCSSPLHWLLERSDSGWALLILVCLLLQEIINHLRVHPLATPLRAAAAELLPQNGCFRVEADGLQSKSQGWSWRWTLGTWGSGLNLQYFLHTSVAAHTLTPDGDGGRRVKAILGYRASWESAWNRGEPV